MRVGASGSSVHGGSLLPLRPAGLVADLTSIQWSGVDRQPRRFDADHADRSCMENFSSVTHRSQAKLSQFWQDGMIHFAFHTETCFCLLSCQFVSQTLPPPFG